jgi:hypothetical protein
MDKPLSCDQSIETDMPQRTTPAANNAPFRILVVMARPFTQDGWPSQVLISDGRKPDNRRAWFILRGLYINIQPDFARRSLAPLDCAMSSRSAQDQKTSKWLLVTL